MKQLSGLDATFLYLETPEMPMHVGISGVSRYRKVASRPDSCFMRAPRLVSRC